jgi:hypothetical protein
MPPEASNGPRPSFVLSWPLSEADREELYAKLAELIETEIGFVVMARMLPNPGLQQTWPSLRSGH